MDTGRKSVGEGKKITVTRKEWKGDNIFKNKEEESLRQSAVLISDELVRSSLAYGVLRKKLRTEKQQHAIQMHSYEEVVLEQEIIALRSASYHSKLSLWTTKNRIVEMKQVLFGLQQQNQQLQQYYCQPEQASQQDALQDQKYQLQNNHSFLPTHQYCQNQSNISQENSQCSVSKELQIVAQTSMLPNSYIKYLHLEHKQIKDCFNQITEQNIDTSFTINPQININLSLNICSVDKFSCKLSQKDYVSVNKFNGDSQDLIQIKKNDK